MIPVPIGGDPDDFFASAAVLEMPSHMFDFTHHIATIPPPPGDAEENYFPASVPPPSSFDNILVDDDVLSGQVNEDDGYPSVLLGSGQGAADAARALPPSSLSSYPSALDSIGSLPPMPEPPSLDSWYLDTRFDGTRALRSP